MAAPLTPGVDTTSPLGGFDFRNQAMPQAALRQAEGGQGVAEVAPLSTLAEVWQRVRQTLTALWVPLAAVLPRFTTLAAVACSPAEWRRAFVSLVAGLRTRS